MLCAEQITVMRNELPVLRGINLSVAPSQALRVSGPNGAGKSTLLRIMSGLRRPDSGRIIWNGQDIRHDLLAHARRVAYLGHRDGLKPELTVRENLGIYGDVTRIDVMEALARVGLLKSADVPVRHLSAGQKRRVALAALLLKDAIIWLLDEPSLGLDLNALERLGEMTRDHLQKGGSLCVTTHTDLPIPFSHAISLPEYPAIAVTG